MMFMFQSYLTGIEIQYGVEDPELASSSNRTLLELKLFWMYSGAASSPFQSYLTGIEI